MMEFLVFSVSGNKYCVDLKKVISVEHSIYISESLKGRGFVKGMAKVRDEIIPVFEIKDEAGKEIKDNTEIAECENITEETKEINNDKKRMSKVIVLENNNETAGLMADDVFNIIKCDKIYKIPDVLKSDKSCFVTGVVSEGEEMILIVDMQNIMLGCDLDE